MQVPVPSNREKAQEQRAKDQLEARRQAYAKVFDGKDGRIVLEDLAQFCRADTTTFHENHHVSNMLDGRREVYLRIQEHTELSPDDLWLRKHPTNG